MREAVTKQWAGLTGGFAADLSDDIQAGLIFMYFRILCL